MKKLSTIDNNWETDCISAVISKILQDRTTTKDNLKEKAENYVRNYLAFAEPNSLLDMDGKVEKIAEKIVKKLDDVSFFQQPLAYLDAKEKRNKVEQDPEKKFIKLEP